MLAAAAVDYQQRPLLVNLHRGGGLVGRALPQVNLRGGAAALADSLGVLLRWQRRLRQRWSLILRRPRR